VKRIPWLSWRLYFLTIPVDVIVLLLSSDHAILNFSEFARWVLVSLIAHASIAPVTAIALFFTSRFNSWKVELIALVALGAVRGMTINIALGILDLEQRVPSLYKVFNSAISLPVWFIALAVFVESRRQFQREFEALFLRSVRKQKSLADQQIVEVGELGEERLIEHLQSVAARLATDIKKVLDLPSSQINFAHHAGKIQDLIHKELRPVSAQLWSNSTVLTPKLSLTALLRISLLEQKLRVFSVSIFFTPYIFIGLNGSQGWEFAAFATFFAFSMNVMIYILCEELFKNKLLERKSANIAIMVLNFLIPLLLILFFIPEQFFWTNKVLAIFLYQFFLTSTHILLLLAFNLYKLLKQQRSAVLKHFEHILNSKEMFPISSSDLSAVRNIDLARYLHGEFQGGLVATKLLLERASQTSDTELARHALRGAVDILTQDHVRLSQSKVSSPVARLEKIAAGWRGIAAVTFSVDWIEGLEASVLNDAILLIDEAVANAVRHAKATSISINGSYVDADLKLQILSDGSALTQNSAGLGTKLFNELASNWEYSKQGALNQLKFTIRRSL
jgi:signal transduction histidine kinase